MNRNKTIRVTPIGRGAPDLPDRGPAWMTDPARSCGPSADNPDLWHSEKRDEQNQAVKICRTQCPFVAECHQYAVENKERWGVWGGRIRSGQKGAQPTPTQPVLTGEELIDLVLTSGPEMFRQLSEQIQIDAIKTGRARGFTYPQLARLWQRSISALQRLAGDTAFDDQVRDLHAKGHSDHYIGFVLGVDPKTAGNSRRRQGLDTLRGPGGLLLKQAVA